MMVTPSGQVTSLKTFSRVLRRVFVHIVLDLCSCKADNSQLVMPSQ
eukprot:COSAG01_NODE_930_length_12664_cov_2.440032_14_plen_46_part_00